MDEPRGALELTSANWAARVAELAQPAAALLRHPWLPAPVDPARVARSLEHYGVAFRAAATSRAMALLRIDEQRQRRSSR